MVVSVLEIRDPFLSPVQYFNNSFIGEWPMAVALLLGVEQQHDVLLVSVPKHDGVRAWLEG